jgi:ABC-2 type transport system ATP-binding protein
MQNILKIENASKKFKGQIIFENVNLEFERGKSYGFVGPNGCGKSVFFKTLCGYSLLDSGQVIYDGRVIGIDNAGVVIEQPEFINELSGMKNLKILAEIKNVIHDDDINDILKKFGLYEECDKKVGKYSVGMKQKLRLVQAFMEKPKIMILDEPMNGLDKKSVHAVEELLKQFVRDGGTLLMTSHIEQQLNSCCDIMYEMEDAGFTRIV